MSKTHKINLENIDLNVELKSVKNIHIRIHAPDGRVTVSAPRRMTLEKIRNFILSKLHWIQKHQNKILSQKREVPKEYKNGEKHYFFGREYVLEVLEKKCKPAVKIENDFLILNVRSGANKKQKQLALQEWYRLQLKEIIAAMIKKWEAQMNVKVAEFGIKKMKTRWGTCNPRAKRIWINLELAKRPIECLEHIVVHEMVHLLEHKHNKIFFSHMDNFLPSWRQSKEELRRLHLGC